MKKGKNRKHQKTVIPVKGTPKLAVRNFKG